MGQLAPSHLCVTGDLVNLALIAEIDRAADWLSSIHAPPVCTIVPGNHDALVCSTTRHMLTAWAPWMGGSPGGPARFPFVAESGPVSFIGLSTAVPTAIGLASGSLDAAQLARLPELLANHADRFRVLMLHHPPVGQSDSWRRRLRGSHHLLGILREHGCELILHGHLQKPARDEIPGPCGPIPVFGAGSASLTENSRGESGHFHHFQLDRSDSGWSLRADHFRYLAATRSFGIESSESLTRPF